MRCSVKYDWVSGSRDVVLVEGMKPLQADLVDPQRNVGIEYVEGREDFRFGGANPHAAAALIAAAVQEQGNGITLGALYDPSSELPRELRWAHRGDKKDQAKAECRRLLRVQVKDFVDWLKGQGIM